MAVYILGLGALIGFSVFERKYRPKGLHLRQNALGKACLWLFGLFAILVVARVLAVGIVPFEVLALIALSVGVKRNY